MISTLWRDGYGTTVEVHHGAPEVCPDGEVRTWHDVTVTDGEYYAEPTVVGFRMTSADLAELGGILQAIGAEVTA